jgi:hypothetical protein
VVVFEDVEFEVFEVLVAEGAAMVAADGLLDAVTAVDVAAAGDEAVGDGVEADCALEFVLEFRSAYSEAVLV